jgi:hypothetical protein
VRRLHSQHGAALLLGLLIVALAALAVFTTQLGGGNTLIRQAANTSPMKEAAEAVLGYSVINYGDGRLPLPDMGYEAPAHAEGAAAANPAGLTTNAIVFGRLPWRSLGVPAPRDEAGECLWYAVGGASKGSPVYLLPDTAAAIDLSAPPLVNWDTLGEFELFTADGAGNLLTADANPHNNRPLALIFAAGAPLPGQDRSSSGNPLETVEKCGGNYGAANYLDTQGADSIRLGGRSNAPLTGGAAPGRLTDYSSDANRAITYYDHSPAQAANYGPKSAFKQPVSAISDGQNFAVVNDRVLALTTDDVFRRLVQQQSFQNNINGRLLDPLVTCLQDKLVPALGLAALTGSPARHGGKLPSLTAYGCPKLVDTDPLKSAAQRTQATRENLTMVERWTDSLWYVACDGPAKCISQGAIQCDGVLILGGMRTANQRRTTAAEKADPAQYLEGDTLALLAAGTASPLPTVSGFGAASSETDIVRCLVRPVGSSSVDVAQLVDAAPSIGGLALVSRDTAEQRITLGNPDITPDAAISQLAGCTWSGTPLAFGSGLRAYFRYTLVQRGDGFFFSVIDAERNSAAVCGGADPSGRFLGYAGRNLRNDGSLVTPPIDFPKIGIEFDTERNDYSALSPCNDRDDSTSRHVAVMYWGYSHDAPTQFTDGNANTLTRRPFFGPDDCFQPVPTVDYFEDDNYHGLPLSGQTGYPDPHAGERQTVLGLSTAGKTFYVRIDISRTYDSGLNGATFHTRAWVVDAPIDGMSNLAQDFVDTSSVPPTLDDQVFIRNRVDGIASFDQIRFGFTNAQSDGSAGKQRIDIFDLAVKSR